MQGINSLVTEPRLGSAVSSGTTADDARPNASAQAAAVPVDAPEVQLYALQEDFGMMLAQSARRKDVERMRPGVSDEAELILEEDRENRLDSLARAMKSGNQSLREFLRQARGLFPDDSDLVLALRSRRRMVGAAGGEGAEVANAADGANGAGALDGSGEAGLLDSAIGRVFKDGNERHIKAGINAAAHARRFGERLNLCARMMRGMYRDFLDFADALPDLYDDWLSRFAYDQRVGLAQYIGGTLIADRRAQDPSCEQAVFSSLFAQCDLLRMMTVAEHLFVQVMHDSANSGTRAPLEQHLAGLLTTMMRDPSQVKLAVGALCTQADTSSARERFVQRVYCAFAALPAALYPDVTCRETVLTDILGLTTPCF
ncbi:HrpJ domain-containing protein [Xanthomonas phaseoli pv. phaseoli]|uniref:Xanthomonas secretion apparatus protein n=1 Tax=Xanthomonas campestris pv. phaseoli TaxID=317013 RepID=A0AB34QIP7_XANCH|nr:HrpJ domain-containing protein [Xanthomonas phaseoli]ATS23150.1 hypothetical protein XppCFBP412P_18345 [Xanthomonas phaseoli pv. phaseoli]ATS34306.1 hypothetical protein XppCFBP6982P_10750 [Xanthomonas phaseoli pv. phaseoli]KHD60352.1 hypothetical protein PK63_20425 [Xanthomonas phaseoli pv. phaseoli]KHD64506.1 hypothetical protein PK68_06320 [Xanthomonas phaseoli pv. phaseoli]KHS26757.1 hypothetical protein RM66_07055 [Xanthomonas phaseoli pv. phaseoli]